MGTFGILVIALTFIYIVYYCVVIMLDLRDSRNKQQNEVEVFDTTDLELEDNTVSTNVTEENEGGFRLYRGDDTDESQNQPIGYQSTDDEYNQDTNTLTDSAIDQSGQDSDHHGATVIIGNSPSTDDAIGTDEYDEGTEFSNYADDEPSDSQATTLDENKDNEDAVPDTPSPLSQELNDIKDNRMNDIVPEYEGELNQMELFADLFNPLQPYKIKLMG